MQKHLTVEFHQNYALFYSSINLPNLYLSSVRSSSTLPHLECVLATHTGTRPRWYPDQVLSSRGKASSLPHMCSPSFPLLLRPTAEKLYKMDEMQYTNFYLVASSPIQPRLATVQLPVLSVFFPKHLPFPLVNCNLASP